MEPQNFRQIKRSVVLEYLEKYPDTSSHALARMLKRDHPELFIDTENARCNIRSYRGANGKRNRELIRLKKYYRYAV